MGITPTDNNCMSPTEVFRARTPAALTAPPVLQEGETYNSKPMEMTTEEQLVLVSPKQLCKPVYAIICTILGGKGRGSG